MMDDKKEKIRHRAHEIWEAAGRPHGSDHEHWLQAEREVMGDTGDGAKPAAETAPRMTRAKAEAKSGSAAPAAGRKATVKESGDKKPAARKKATASSAKS